MNPRSYVAQAPRVSVIMTLSCNLYSLELSPRGGRTRDFGWRPKNSCKSSETVSPSSWSKPRAVTEKLKKCLGQIWIYSCAKINAAGSWKQSPFILIKSKRCHRTKPCQITLSNWMYIHGKCSRFFKETINIFQQENTTSQKQFVYYVWFTWPHLHPPPPIR